MSSTSPDRALRTPCRAACPIADRLDRRAFVARTLLATFGAALTACGDGIFGVDAVTVTALPTGAPITLRVADFPSLVVSGGIATTSVGGFPLAIESLASGGYAIWSMVCPHRAHEVQPVVGGFTCTGHAATWNASGIWTGGQTTSDLVRIPATYDAVTGLLTISGTNAPVVEQDFTIDLTQHPKLAPVGGWEAITRPMPGGGTTRLFVVNTPLQGYLAYGAACGHMGRYLFFDDVAGHWHCPSHNAEFDLYGQKLVDADDDKNIPTAQSLVMLTVTQTGTLLRIQGNPPAEAQPD
jgi:Rieske Fe-S protein